MSEPITFMASFPPIQGAIRRSGDAGGMRIQLDIPESEMANAAYLLAMVQERLRITVEVISENVPDRTISRRKARQRDNKRGSGVQ